MQVESYRLWSDAEHRTWAVLYRNLEHCRAQQAFPLFTEGVRRLELSADHIPDLGAVNQRLSELTGWKGVPVAGLEDNTSFFPGLARREFPLGNFIRDARDVNYTPAPDVFHDLYGHLPLLADPAYAAFCQEFGARAAKYIDRPDLMEQWGRLFWFGVEFPLVETPVGRRIFGGGILSSFGESNYALSAEPEVLPFDIEVIRAMPYRVDEMQRRIFILERPEQLYRCLEAYESGMRS